MSASIFRCVDLSGHIHASRIRMISCSRNMRKLRPTLILLVQERGKIGTQAAWVPQLKLFAIMSHIRWS